MKQPIPDSALDDRLGFVGTTGSGKTYNAGGCVERLLEKQSRCVIPDPLGVWWGLRLMADGKTASPHDVAIFGGPHGDLPLTEAAGAVIGEAVAGMKESCILDLSELGTKAAERRFMYTFLTALYKHASGEPVHVIFDEADMWAPQRLMDKEGEAAKLLGMMETIVRRGRVKGFIPWLITQRPAVLSKNVLSQVDGLVAFKLTSSQDRDAIGDWVEGQADKAQWKQIWSSLPTMERGQGVVWIPARSILQTVSFPAKTTFDSSRTPKRGERRQQGAALKPLDVGKLKERLATVEAETKANDPKALKAEIARLQNSIAALNAKSAQAVDPVQLQTAEQRGYQRGFDDAFVRGVRALGNLWKHLLGPIFKMRDGFNEIQAIHEQLFEQTNGRAEGAPSIYDVDESQWQKATGKWIDIQSRIKSGSPAAPVHRAAQNPTSAPRPSPRSAPLPSPSASGDGPLSPALQKCIDAIAWWRKIGFEPVERARAAVVAGYSPRASTFSVYLADLAKRGLVDTRMPGKIMLTDAGLSIANHPTAATAEELRLMARNLLGPKERGIFDIIYAAYPNEIRRNEVAERAGLSPTASTCSVYLAAIAAYGVIDTPQTNPSVSPGAVRAADWLFP